MALDLFGRRIVGWSMGAAIDSELACRALDMAWHSRLPAGGLIFRSDRGSQYANGRRTDLLAGHGIQASMNRKGDCWDNACSETLFGSLKVERLHGAEFDNHRKGKDAAPDWLLWRNGSRTHSTLSNNIVDESIESCYCLSMETPKTLQAAILFFGNPDNCIAYMRDIRWPDGVVLCPICGRNDVSWLAKQEKWQCKSKHIKRQFSAKVGTIFEDSPLPLDKWLMAGWMLANCKNGVSSYEIARSIGVTQKSAWFMLQRLRLASQDSFDGGKLSGEVEVDETFIGGKGPQYAPCQA